MNINRNFLLIILLCAGLSACSTNPTVFGFFPGKEDKTKWSLERDITVPIIRQIRCETRDAMFAAAKKLLLQGGFDGYGDTNRILEKFNEDPETLARIHVWQLHPVAQTMASFFGSSTAAFDLELTNKETNNNILSGALNPSTGAHPVTIKLGDHSAKLERQGKHAYGIGAISFDTLQKLDCTKPGSSNSYKARKLSKDWIYPVRGNIGLIKTVAAFIDLSILDSKFEKRRELARASLFSAIFANNWNDYENRKPKRKYIDALEGSYLKTCPYNDSYIKCESDNQQSRSIVSMVIDEFVLEGQALSSCLSKECQIENNKRIGAYKKVLGSAANMYNALLYGFEQVSSGKENKPPTITNTLIFTTTISGGIDPSIEFANGSRAFKFNKLGYSLTNTHTATHQLTFALAAKKKFVPKDLTPKPVPVLLGKKNGYEIILNLPVGQTVKSCKLAACRKKDGSKKSTGEDMSSLFKKLGNLDDATNTDDAFVTLKASPEELRATDKALSDSINRNIATQSADDLRFIETLRQNSEF